MMHSMQSLRPGPSLTRLAIATLAALAAGPASVSGNPRALVVPTDPPDLEWGPCPEFMPERCAIAVLHGDPAEPNADVLFKLPGGTTAPEHWHTSAERMVLISGRLEARYEGQEPATLQPGDYAYGPARLSHEATCRSDDDCLLFIAFEQPVDAFPTKE